MLQPTWCSPCLVLGCGLPSMVAAVRASSFPFGPGHKVHAPVNQEASLALPRSVTHPCSSPSLGKNLGFSIRTTQGPALGPLPGVPCATPHVGWVAGCLLFSGCQGTQDTWLRRPQFSGPQPAPRVLPPLSQAQLDRRSPVSPLSTPRPFY